mmetsp:Transcript_4347/g.18384  ORF Transcript_4347/g.18384 Transcript_4347/m.18384 type:complete len:424 (+) Transcript_4347:2699-3970(+)
MGKLLHFGEEAEVLAHGEGRPEDVVLRTHAEAAADVVHLRGRALAVDGRAAGRGGDEAGEHVEGGALAGAVVAEDDGDLALEAVEVDVLDGSEVAELAAEATHGHEAAVGALGEQAGVGGLEELVLVARRHEALAPCASKAGPFVHGAEAADLAPVRGGDEEVEGAGHAELAEAGGHDLVDVPGQHEVDDGVEGHHEQGGVEGPVAQQDVGVGAELDADALVFVDAQGLDAEGKGGGGRERRGELALEGNLVCRGGRVHEVEGEEEQNAHDGGELGAREEDGDEHDEGDRGHAEEEEEEEACAKVRRLEHGPAADGRDEDGLDEEDEDVLGDPAEAEGGAVDAHHLERLAKAELLLAHEAAEQHGDGEELGEDEEEGEDVLHHGVEAVALEAHDGEGNEGERVGREPLRAHPRQEGGEGGSCA